MIKDLRFKNKIGFTLVELLIVISIMGILTVVLAGSFTVTQKRSRDGARKANLAALAKAVDMYYADHGSWPDASPIDNKGGEFKDTNGNVYMKVTPSDSTKAYGYEVSGDGKSFKVFTYLENIEDKDCMTCLPDDKYSLDTSKYCCYVITSSNINVSTDISPK